MMTFIYVLEAWEDSFGGGNTWVAGYYSTEEKAQNHINTVYPKDPCVHYQIKRVILR